MQPHGSWGQELVSCQSEATLHKSQSCVASLCCCVLSYLSHSYLCGPDPFIYSQFPLSCRSGCFFSAINQLRAWCSMSDRLVQLSRSLAGLAPHPVQGKGQTGSSQVKWALLLSSALEDSLESLCQCPASCKKGPWGIFQREGLSASTKTYTVFSIKQFFMSLSSFSCISSLHAIAWFLPTKTEAAAVQWLMKWLRDILSQKLI